MICSGDRIRRPIYHRAGDSLFSGDRKRSTSTSIRPHQTRPSTSCSIVGDCAHVLRNGAAVAAPPRRNPTRRRSRHWWGQIDKWSGAKSLALAFKQLIKPQFTPSSGSMRLTRIATHITTEVGKHQMWGGRAQSIASRSPTVETLVARHHAGYGSAGVRRRSARDFDNRVKI